MAHNASPPAPGVDELISRSVDLLIDRNDVTVERVAASTGLSRAGLYRRLAGDSPWKASDVAALAAYFGVLPNDLFFGAPIAGRRAGTA